MELVFSTVRKGGHALKASLTKEPKLPTADEILNEKLATMIIVASPSEEAADMAAKAVGPESSARYAAAVAEATAESRALGESAKEQAGAGRAGGALDEPAYAAALARARATM